VPTAGRQERQCEWQVSCEGRQSGRQSQTIKHGSATRRPRRTNHRQKSDLARHSPPRHNHLKYLSRGVLAFEEKIRRTRRTKLKPRKQKANSPGCGPDPRSAFAPTGSYSRSKVEEVEEVVAQLLVVAVGNRILLSGRKQNLACVVKPGG
jgi:hypothetical protein